ncbi:hypothetical protein [Roseobacter denitrificans]|uniref:Uncharacterized protein n=1 Tax=Roseobacter denitrificans (strain ATCC 33942 / OCh 114) TaxID=375451 RepID=Q07GM3_ROSDO|nr:hypothetical protein [Roseobacter denitrificans]ABI93376.1 hypothetical protein RD1_A0077 [Roseobacter denitrificans OCh 114]SFG47364.1 hypothetical protein SAMN05443635_1217 [Roseobacter denitrificans OCh 114]
MTVPSPIRAVWKTAELMIAFHKNKKKERRDEPYLWRPKDAIARLLSKPEDQEAFIVLKGHEDAADVQIKLHPDKMIIRRDHVLGWSGIVIDDHSVKVLVDDDWIRIDHDGAVKIERDAETTYLEGDGSIIRTSPDAEIMISSDGQSMSRRTGEQLDAFTPEGFISRKRS